jgi:NAD+ synthase (glutamine-hydrolysing)
MLLPSKYSSNHSIEDAVKLAKNLNVQFNITNIQTSVDAVLETVKPIFSGYKEDITEENIQARIRGVLLMALSNKFGNILLNTSNKSEIAVGYGTLYGDMNGGLSVLGDVFKTDIYKLAHFINSKKEIIPSNIISKPPSAELRPDQKDTDSLPEYSLLDSILFRYIEQQKSEEDIIHEGFDPALVSRVLKMVNFNEYKRFQTPPILRISSKAFGLGRKMPIVARY